MASHYIEKCSKCDGIISQCRCPGPKKVRYSVCSKCERSHCRGCGAKLQDNQDNDDNKVCQLCLTDNFVGDR